MAQIPSSGNTDGIQNSDLTWILQEEEGQHQLDTSGSLGTTFGSDRIEPFNENDPSEIINSIIVSIH